MALASSMGATMIRSAPPGPIATPSPIQNAATTAVSATARSHVKPGGRTAAAVEPQDRLSLDGEGDEGIERAQPVARARREARREPAHDGGGALELLDQVVPVRVDTRDVRAAVMQAIVPVPPEMRRDHEDGAAEPHHDVLESLGSDGGPVPDLVPEEHERHVGVGENEHGQHCHVPGQRGHQEQAADPGDESDERHDQEDAEGPPDEHRGRKIGPHHGPERGLRRARHPRDDTTTC